MFAACSSVEGADFPSIEDSRRYLGKTGEETQKLSVATTPGLGEKSCFVPPTRNSTSSRCEDNSCRAGWSQSFGAVLTWAGVRTALNALFICEHSQ